MATHRILILTSSTGGGHDMRADALSQWLHKIHAEGVAIERWQALEDSSALDRFGVWLYNQIQRHCPLAHHLYFNLLEFLSLHRTVRGVRGRQRWLERARTFRPDVVVSTHAHLNHGYFELLRAALAPEPPRCLTYCGELSGGYGFSRHWVNPEADGFIAAVPACAEAACRAGMPADRVHTGGFLLQPHFYESEPEAEQLEIEDLVGERLEGPVVLLGTGANGANNHGRILQHLDGLPGQVNFLALCGHNQQAYTALQPLDIAPHRVIPLGYQKNMAPLLRGVDLAFIRPGSGTTSECIHCQCPILLNGIGGIMPQERITRRGLERIGIRAQVVRRAAEFGSALAEQLAPDSKQSLQQQRAILSAFQSGGRPEDIVREVFK